MNENYSMLTTTGVIATLVSMLFAVAALVIANRRKKHHQAMQRAAAPAANHAHPAARPDAGMAFAAPPPAATPAAAPVAMAENSMYDSTRSTSSPLFKRLGRVGVEQVTTSSAESSSTDDQTAAWE
jgi:zona occludens toxin (predicted ATPase)